MGTLWKTVAGFFKSRTTMAKADEDEPSTSNSSSDPVQKQSEPQVNENDDDEETDIEDEDFVPEAHDAGAVSEEISDDADEDEDSTKKSKTDRNRKKSRVKKRKRLRKLANGKRRKTDGSDSDDSSDDADFTPDSSQLDDTDTDTSLEKPLSAEEAKAREEDEKAEMDRLWADFKSSVEADKHKKKDRTVEKVVTKVVDFAGEKVSVQEKVKVNVSNSNGVGNDDLFKVPQSPPVSTTPSPNPNDGEVAGPSSRINMNGDSSSPKKSPSSTPPPRRRGGISILGNDPEAIGLDDLEKRGLSGLLKAFQNKSKSIGTLEKSKLDWDSFKRQEGLEDELQHHNKSRDTFIDKQEFLQRTDHRQFEIEKSMRATARSKRLAN